MTAMRFVSHNKGLCNKSKFEEALGIKIELFYVRMIDHSRVVYF